MAKLIGLRVQQLFAVLIDEHDWCRANEVTMGVNENGRAVWLLDLPPIEDCRVEELVLAIVSGYISGN